MKNKIYGYCRISTTRQNITRQIRNIKSEYPNAEIYQEEYTGTTTNRPIWKRLNSLLREGDTLIFDSVSRMSRNADEGIELYEDLYNRGVNIIFLKESYVNTEIYKKSLEQSIPTTGTDVDIILKGINKYLITLAKKQIKLAFEQSEKEVKDLKQRTAEGVETARRNGKQIGRKKGASITTKKSIENKKKIIALSEDFNGIYKDVEVLDFLHLSRNTFYKYKREIKQSMENLN
jgi:DNA invertase Pin-like site-specific DNA recombinase